MHKQIEDVAAAVEHIRFIEEKLWGGRPALWSEQGLVHPGVHSAFFGKYDNERNSLHRVDIELKASDGSLDGWIKLGWLVSIDFNVVEPRAQYEFMIGIKSSGGDMGLTDHIRLRPRDYQLERKTAAVSVHMHKYIDAWIHAFDAFAVESDWRCMPIRPGESEQLVRGSCSPQDDQRFARFLGDTLFDEIGKVPRPTGV